MIDLYRVYQKNVPSEKFLLISLYGKTWDIMFYSNVSRCPFGISRPIFFQEEIYIVGGVAFCPLMMRRLARNDVKLKLKYYLIG